MELSLLRKAYYCLYNLFPFSLALSPFRRRRMRFGIHYTCGVVRAALHNIITGLVIFNPALRFLHIHSDHSSPIIANPHQPKHPTIIVPNDSSLAHHPSSSSSLLSHTYIRALTIYIPSYTFSPISRQIRKKLMCSCAGKHIYFFLLHSKVTI